MAQVYNSQLDAFDLYHKYMSEQKPKSILDGPALPALGHAIAGSTGAAISNVCTYPLDLIITRLQIQRQLRKKSNTASEGEYKSVADAAEKIYCKDGLSGFYTGVLEDTTKTIADSFLFFLAYNFLRTSRLKTNGSKHLPVIDELGVGFVAGAFSKLLTTPISNVVTRLQTASMVASRDPSKSPESVTAASIARQIHEEKGLVGFWSGYSASLVLTLNPSLTFFFFETFKRLTLPRASRDSPPASATFFLAAISKALASSITYPFSLAKARAQSSRKRVNESDAKLPTGSRSTIDLTRRTVFSTIIAIAQTEGISALYEGLAGEVMKGFFSHGITMIVKEAVHKVIIKLYFTLSALLARTQSPSTILHNTINTASPALNKATQTISETTASLPSPREVGQSTYETVKGLGTSAGEKLGRAGEQAYDAVEKAYGESQRIGTEWMGEVTDGAEEVSDYVADYLDDMADRIGLGGHHDD